MEPNGHIYEFFKIPLESGTKKGMSLSYMKYEIPLEHKKQWRGVFYKDKFRRNEVEMFMDLEAIKDTVEHEIGLLNLPDGSLLKKWLKTEFDGYVYNQAYAEAWNKCEMFRIIMTKDCPEDAKKELLSLEGVEHVEPDMFPEFISEPMRNFKPF